MNCGLDHPSSVIIVEMVTMNNTIKKVSGSIILAGVIIFLIGAYYSVVKAGIPYQDPTPEMQIQYAVDSKIGETLAGCGFGLTVLGVIVRLIVKKLK